MSKEKWSKREIINISKMSDSLTAVQSNIIIVVSLSVCEIVINKLTEAYVSLRKNQRIK